MLWCDGVRHCPSGFDERDENCSYRFGVTLLYVAIGTGTLGIFLILLLATGCLKYCIYRRRRLQRQSQLQKKLPQDTSETLERKSKKVQQLNVKQLNTTRNNGLDITAGINENISQPRYANSTFNRIGRYDSGHHLHHHYQQHLQYDRQDFDDIQHEQRDYEKFSKDSIC